MNSYLHRALLILLVSQLLPSFALAAQKVGTLVLDAETMVRDGRNQIIRLNKNVQVIFDNQHLRCDQASIDLKTKTIHAQGNLVIVGPEARVEAERASMEYEKNTGILYGAFIEMGQVSFEGDVVYKTGPRAYEVIKGSYTACTTCPPAWHFTGSKVTATAGGYAHVRNALFHVASVPIFWTPYMVLPLNSKRQTGLLFPTFEYGQDSGLSMSESFFWAMSESQDSTWTIKHYEKRGPKALLNYRYVFTESSRGEFDGGLINDRVFTGPTGSSGAQTRWIGKYRHHFELPEGYVQRTQLTLVSDLRYPLDFPEEIEGAGAHPSLQTGAGKGDPALDNRISITKNTHSQHASIDASIYTNLLKENSLSDNRDAVHRFPTIKYSATPRRILDSPLLFQFDMNYTNFTRDTLTFDDIERDADGNRRVKSVPDGVYEPDDQIRAGQRIDFQPHLSLPFRIGPYLDFLPSLTYRDTGYQFSIGDRPTAQRRLVRGQISSRTRFSRVFGESDVQAVRYKHEIQPELTYTVIPWLDQPQDHPFFGNVVGEPAYTADQAISNTDIIHFDYEDRIYDRNVLTLGVGNTLIRRNWNGDTATYRQLASLKIQQSYDFFESYRLLTANERRQPWSDLRTTLDIGLDFVNVHSVLRYFPYIGKAMNSTRVRLSNSKGHFGQVTYSQNFTIPRGTDQVQGQTEDYILDAGFTSKYANFSGGITYSTVTKQIQEKRADLLLIPTGDCWGIHLTYSAPILGEPKVSASFRMNYGSL